jgi:hypothetical protein
MVDESGRLGKWQTSTPPDDAVVIHVEGYFGWWDRVRLVFGRKVRFHIVQPVWVKHLEDGRHCCAVIKVEPNITVEPFFQRQVRAQADYLEDTQSK